MQIVIYLTIFLLSSFSLLGNTYVLLVSFDGFRWDYLNRGLTPNMTAFAERGARALSLEPSFPSGTFPNHYSIVTGLYPENHGIISNFIADPYTNNVFTIRDSIAVRDPKWYLGEAIWETAKRQGVRTASFFWPGSELTLNYRRPDYFVPFNPKIPYKKRIDSVISWLKLPFENRPRFITLYFEETDTQGHNYGPDSPETDSAIKLCDSLFGYLIDNLKKINFLDSINIIVVSDHGMTKLHQSQIINISEYFNVGGVKINSYGYFAFISGEKDSLAKVYSTLKKLENNFKVYKREEVPKYFNFSNNPFIGEIVIIPEFGWTISRDTSEYFYRIRGNHGYDNHWIDMHGIFIASGPSFKQNYVTGTLKNVDIYPLMCKILNIVPRNNIDGKLERIEYILK